MRITLIINPKGSTFFVAERIDDSSTHQPFESTVATLVPSSFWRASGCDAKGVVRATARKHLGALRGATRIITWNSINPHLEALLNRPRE